MNMQYLIIIAALGFTGCGSTAGSSGTTPAAPATTTASAEADDDMVCHNETRPGTHIPRRVCRSAVEIESDKQFARDVILSPSSRPATAGSTGIDPKAQPPWLRR